MKKTTSKPFPDLYSDLKRAMVNGTAERVVVGEWQAIRDANNPMAITWEIQDISLKIDIPETISEWVKEVDPNMPWAEDHFKERVGKVPLNPPPSNAWWPFARRGNAEHKTIDERFSHTYPERIWPRFANEGNKTDAGRQIWVPHVGIRYEYGDLDDVVALLGEYPGTRQAYLPIWFPEDTGSVSGQRVPCTLGYHFMIRDGQLRVAYYMRSCDLLRHFPDDVYMAGRLAQWLKAELRTRYNYDVSLSYLVMHIGSLHVFEGDMANLRQTYGS